MALFPLFAELDGRPVLVIGGGEVATRKVDALLRAGALVRLCARTLSPTLAQWQQQGRLQRLPGEFDPAWIDSVWLVVAATDDHQLNRAVAAEATARQRWVNVVDDLALSSYHVPAVVDRSPLMIAISSGGHAPMLARRLRERLEAELDQRWALLARLFARWRPQIRERLPDTGQRRRWFERVLNGEVGRLAGDGDAEATEQALTQALNATDDYRPRGDISVLVDVDGRADLLTLRALRRLNLADLILVTPGVSAAILELARRDAERAPLAIDAAPLATLAQALAAGQHVVCLCSGQNAAQLLVTHLQRQGIACEIVSAGTERAYPAA